MASTNSEADRKRAEEIASPLSYGYPSELIPLDVQRRITDAIVTFAEEVRRGAWNDAIKILQDFQQRMATQNSARYEASIDIEVVIKKLEAAAIRNEENQP